MNQKQSARHVNIVVDKRVSEGHVTHLPPPTNSQESESSEICPTHHCSVFAGSVCWTRFVGFVEFVKHLRVAPSCVGYLIGGPEGKEKHSEWVACIRMI